MARGPKDLSPDDRRIWARVTGSVTPPKSRKAARVMLDMALPADPTVPTTPKSPNAPKPRPRPVPQAMAPRPPSPVPAASRSTPEVLEPRRQRRLSRERDPIEARIDLHGYGRFQA